jgi:hypothetical protein
MVIRYQVAGMADTDWLRVSRVRRPLSAEPSSRSGSGPLSALSALLMARYWPAMRFSPGMNEGSMFGNYPELDLHVGAGDGNPTRTISLGSFWHIPADPLDLAAVARRYDISAPLRSL